MARTIDDLRQMQALPLSLKVSLTKSRIRQWVNEYGEDGVYISFSGGKDSTVLLHLVREMYPDIPAVFVNTGLEYPEIVQFVKTFDNVEIIRPKMNFKKVIETYGYPFISKDVSKDVYVVRSIAKNRGIDVKDVEYYRRNFNRNSEYCKKNPSFCKEKFSFLFDADFAISDRCCHQMKKNPVHDYERKTGRKPIMAIMASESRMRTTTWIKLGCNAFQAKRQISNPMSFWTEQDVLKYIKEYGIEICSVYGDIVEDESKGQQVAGQLKMDLDGTISECECILRTTGRTRTGCMFCGYGCHLEKPGEGRFEQMKITHPKIYEWIMKPCAEGGLGYKDVIDWLNENGGLNIRY